MFNDFKNQTIKEMVEKDITIKRLHEKIIKLQIFEQYTYNVVNKLFSDMHLNNTFEDVVNILYLIDDMKKNIIDMNTIITMVVKNNLPHARKDIKDITKTIRDINTKLEQQIKNKIIILLTFYIFATLCNVYYIIYITKSSGLQIDLNEDVGIIYFSS